MSIPLVFVSDPGHGWLQVPLADYPDALNYGTGYGYVDAEHAYLEEDCEAPAFLRAHPDLRDNIRFIDIDSEFREVYGSVLSPIPNNYDPFSVTS